MFATILPLSLLFIAIFRLVTVFTRCLLYIFLLDMHIHNRTYVKRTTMHRWSYISKCTW